jgi:hypothetical protein
MENEQVDSVVKAVLTKFIDRSKFGKLKYGTDLDRTDLSILDWIRHAQEEHMDAILYLEKLAQEYKKDQSKKDESKKDESKKQL